MTGKGPDRRYPEMVLELLGSNNGERQVEMLQQSLCSQRVSGGTPHPLHTAGAKSSS